LKQKELRGELKRVPLYYRVSGQLKKFNYQRGTLKREIFRGGKGRKGTRTINGPTPAEGDSLDGTGIIRGERETSRKALLNWGREGNRAWMYGDGRISQDEEVSKRKGNVEGQGPAVKRNEGSIRTVGGKRGGNNENKRRHYYFTERIVSTKKENIMGVQGKR